MTEDERIQQLRELGVGPDEWISEPLSIWSGGIDWQTVLREVGDVLMVRFVRRDVWSLPLHRSGDAATTMRCATCEGGGCLDCTDPA